MLLPSIRRSAAPDFARSARCLSCRHFLAEPLSIERALPGLNTLSSGYASVRAGDGLCPVHDRYVAESSSCEQHSAAQGA